MTRKKGPAGAGGAGSRNEALGSDFTNSVAQPLSVRQDPLICWLRLLDQSEERSRRAPIEQRPKHRRLYKYLAVRLARAVLAEGRRR